MRPMRPMRPTRPISAKRPILGAAAAFVLALAAAGYARYRYRATYRTFDTMFGKARIYQVEGDDGESVRLLEVAGIVQSGTYLDDRYTDLVFDYLKRYDELFDIIPDVKRVCVLGCGGYDYPEHLIAHYPQVTVDAVEIDPAITAIARRYFHLDRLIEEYDTETTGRLNLICNDALAHLHSADVRYDAIVNDTFDAGTPPAHLTTREFVRAVRSRLLPGGLYLTNIVAPLEGPRSQFLHEQVALLESEFAEVRVIPCATDCFADEDNVIVLARAAVKGNGLCGPLRLTPKLPDFHP